MGETLCRGDLFGSQGLSDGDSGKGEHAFFGLFVIGAFNVDTEKTVKTDDLSGGCEMFVAGGWTDVDSGFLNFGVGHLRGYRAFPDQRVEPFFLRVAFDRRVADICRTYSFMRFLSTFRIGMIAAHFQIFRPYVVVDLLRDRSDGLVGQVDGVGTHICDMSGLVETLGDHHGLRDRETEFARRFLLERGGGERWRRTFLERPHIDVTDRECRRGAVLEEGLCRGDVGQAAAEFRF